MSLSQVLLVFASVLVAARAFEAKVETQAIYDRWRNRTEQEHPECEKTWPITNDEKDGYFRQHKVTDTPTFKCYLNCIHMAFNLTDENGRINRDQFFKTFERMTYQMLDFCDGSVVEQTDKCAQIYDYVDCLMHYGKVYA
ncbi:uncharacterized protein LOC116181106 [Photinus pyralis]|uniref:uncharacterized protein LOC116180165 n=1 Tax=Photinus pyralis TaxID=7054 RepID=UPI0012677696|nr:uncharacterized protein LOC116180165 [Photinus pyralis]XP_031357239.1 uncharacterized protein LOC116181106 [Photinus pyralis]